MIKRVCVLIILLGSFGCATYQSRVSSAKTNLRGGQCDLALEKFEKLASEKSDDQLLYLLEYGSALQICRDFKKSSEIFIQAEKLSEQLDYHSVSNLVGATLLNEEMIQYKGDAFELFFINAMNAINFLELGKLDEALVEVRRINEKFVKLRDEEKKNFELNSFSQYLSGLIWDVSEKFDDACLSYKQSFKLDQHYLEVAKDALRVCDKARRKADFDEIAKLAKFDSSETQTYKSSKLKKSELENEITIIFLQGLGPTKANRLQSSVYPRLVPTYTPTKRLKVGYESNSSVDQTVRTRTVYSVEKAAISTLEADFNSLGGRRFGSRVAKEVVADQIRQKDRALGNLAWFVMVASERADLRNWTLLPESIQVVRIHPKRNSKIKLEGEGYAREVTKVYNEIDLAQSPRKKIYIIREIQ